MRLRLGLQQARSSRSRGTWTSPRRRASGRVSSCAGQIVTQRLRVGAILGTMDELDVLPGAVEGLRSIGIERIVVFDHGSTDGSLEYLAEAEKQGDLWTVHVTAEDGGDVHCGMRLRLAQALGVERVIFLDSDEIWLPAGGLLGGVTEAMDSEVLVVSRFNVVSGPDGPYLPEEITPATYDKVLVYAQPVADLFEHMREHPETPWIRGHLEPKLMIRPGAVRAIHAGSHDADLGPGQQMKEMARNIVIAHQPVRSYERFERRARNVRAAIESEPEWFSGSQAWQWVRWARLLEEGRLREEYERQLVLPEHLEELRASGTVRSVAEILERVVPAYPSEEDYRSSVRRAQPWVMAAGQACRAEGVPAGPWTSVFPHGGRPTVRVDPGHVVKLFGPWGDGQDAFRHELGAFRLLERDPELPMPRLVGHGRIDDDWSYLLMTLIPGVALDAVRDGICADALVEVAAWAGRFIRRLHALPFEREEAERSVAWFEDALRSRLASLEVTLAASGLLPPHLVAQLGDWLPSPPELAMPESGPVPLHGDLHDDHILGHHVGDRFHPSGVIDPGRLLFGHPLYELGPVWRWLRNGERRPMAAFLAEAGLPGFGQPGFPRLALAWCLLHQGITAFPDALPGVSEADSLDELAASCFGGV
jgi:hygromycin-B 7''-O-kinase